MKERRRGKAAGKHRASRDVTVKSQKVNRQGLTQVLTSLEPEKNDTLCEILNAA